MSPADKISLHFPSIKIFRVFCQKEEDRPLLFHKTVERLRILTTIVSRRAGQV